MWCWSVLFCFMIVLSAGADEVHDWPHYLGPHYDLQSGLQSFNVTSATEAWNAKVMTGMCSVSIVDGLVYTMGNNGTKENKDQARDFVYCLDAQTGREKWTFASASGRSELDADRS